MKLLSHLCTAFFILTVSCAAMADETSFDRKKFDELRTANKPVVVHVHSKSCSTCKKQASLLGPILAMPEFKDLAVMRADYEKESALRKELKATRESTFVVFKGTTEVGRSTGDTKSESIAALFRKAQ